MNSMDRAGTNEWESPPAGPCEICGRMPSRGLAFRGVTGMLVTQHRWSYRGPVCSSCARGLFREFQTKLLLGGWWSLLGLAMTPFMLLTNGLAYHLHQFELDPPEPADPVADLATEGEPLLRRVGPAVAGVLVFMMALNGVML